MVSIWFDSDIFVLQALAYKEMFDELPAFKSTI